MLIKDTDINTIKMCLECYTNMELRFKIEQINELDNVDNEYDFSKWNTTSLSFLYLFLCDDELSHYHHKVERVYNLMDSDRANVIRAIDGSSFDDGAETMLDAIRDKINEDSSSSRA